MHVLIEISESDYQYCLEEVEEYCPTTIEEAVAGGIVLPENFGRLVDADVLKGKFLEAGCLDGKPCYGVEWIDKVPTIAQIRESEDK